MSALRIASGIVAKAALAVLAMTAHAPLLAGDWHTVFTGKTETVEIDTSRFARQAASGMGGLGGFGTPGGVTGWSRVMLDREVKDPGGAYNAIHAQNLYDCDGRRFTTLRRAYFKGDTLVREEAVTRQRANSVQIGSLDERLFNEACRARAVLADAAKAADAAERAAASVGDDSRPAPMHADMRTLADTTRARAVPVADAAPKPVAPGDAAPAAAAPVSPVAPGGDKSRRITLPVIDKAAADAASAAALGAGKPAAGAVAPAPTAAKPEAKGEIKAETKPAAKVEPKPESKPESRTAAKAPLNMLPSALENMAPSERRVRELHYATSGPPRRTAPKKKEESNPAYQMHVHWAYEGEGAPANWSRLNPDYGACASGKRQSPIDIRDGIKVDLETIKFEYKPTRFRAIDNGHTVQITVGDGLFMSVMGKRYELQQFHFHRPSEERINGRSYDMVVHLVHRNDEGQLAVIAVLLERGNEHPLIQTLWNNMPLERDMEVLPAETIDPGALLPESRAYWTYMGSLTTPPCTEGVLWMVFKQPVQVSQEQVSIFSRLYRNNARPVQPANGRLIKESR